MKNFLLITAVIASIVAIYVWPVIDRVRQVAVGYGAKTVCSGVYVSGMTLESLRKNELMGGGPMLPLFMTFDIDNTTKTITTSCLGVKATAKYYGYHKGCSLLPRSYSYAGISSKLDTLKIKHHQKAFQWPNATSKSKNAFHNIDYEKLDKLVSGEFDVHTYSGITKEEIQEDLERIRKGQTRAVVVVYKGKLVAEGYNSLMGLTKDSRLHGWSVTKSVLATLVGIRIKQNKMSLDHLANVTEWSDASMQEQHITVRNMLNMNAGIDCEEKYHVTGDVCKMIFTEDNAAGKFPR
ncbi:unnamed protein product [Owenia fusiformis]|uniref:Uncharacterized protein n=1 Tax=Owenia fusiformis TaxID=6347 RepID=A0A8J1UII9_OWEFU|nr:unnamed protein product [Owenia fusiformis]